MGDPKQESTGSGVAAAIKNLEAFLPRLSSAITGNILPIEQAKLDVSKVISPQQYDLMTQLYKTYGPELAKIAAQNERVGREAGAATDLSLAQGAGGQLAQELASLENRINPEVAGARKAAGTKLEELLNSINLNDANPEAERLVSQEAGRSGNISNPSASSTVANALGFGDQLAKRRAQLSSAISSATQFLPTAKSGVDAVGVALGRGANPAGEARFTGAAQTGNESFDLGSNLFGSSMGLEQQRRQLDAQRETALDKVNQSIAAIGSVGDGL